MKSVIVYRVNRALKTKIPIGSLIERRKTERGKNFVGLLSLARKTFLHAPQETFQIDVGGMSIEF